MVGRLEMGKSWAAQWIYERMVMFLSFKYGLVWFGSARYYFLSFFMCDTPLLLFGSRSLPVRSIISFYLSFSFDFNHDRMNTMLFI